MRFAYPSYVHQFSLVEALAADKVRVVDASESSIESREAALLALREVGQPRCPINAVIIYVPTRRPETDEQKQIDPFALYAEYGAVFLRDDKRIPEPVPARQAGSCHRDPPGVCRVAGGADLCGDRCHRRRRELALTVGHPASGVRPGDSTCPPSCWSSCSRGSAPANEPAEIQAGMEAVLETLNDNDVRPNEANAAQSRVATKGKHRFIDKVHVNYVEKDRRHWAALENFDSRRVAIGEKFYRGSCFPNNSRWVAWTTATMAGWSNRRSVVMA